MQEDCREQACVLLVCVLLVYELRAGGLGRGEPERDGWGVNNSVTMDRCKPMSNSRMTSNFSHGNSQRRTEHKHYLKDPKSDIDTFAAINSQMIYKMTLDN